MSLPMPDGSTPTDNGNQVAFAMRRAASDANRGVGPVREEPHRQVLDQLAQDRTSYLCRHFDVTDGDGQTYRVLVVRV